MQHLIFSILRGPFWLQFVFAAVFIWMGYTFQTASDARSARDAALLQQPAPEAMPISDMQQRYDSKVSKEVTVTAQLAMGRTTRLIRKTNFITTSEELLYVLVDADATLFDAVARGAIVVDAGQEAKVAAWVEENAVGYGAEGFILDVSGMLTNAGHSSMAYEAIEERGLERGPDFFFITPHFDGRLAALTPKPFAGFKSGLAFYAIAVFFALLGAVKYRGGNGPAAGLVKPTMRAHNPTGLTGDQIAQRLIDEDIARARTQAAMANPKQQFGPTLQPPVPEVFTLPDPVYVPRTPGSPFKEVPPLGQRIHTFFRTVLSPKVIWYAGFLIVFLVMLDLHFESYLTIRLLHLDGPLEEALTTTLGWIVGAGALLIILRGFVWVPPVSTRKSVYDPYLRLAERERQHQHD